MAQDVVVFGASGYSGREVLRLVAGHPSARVVLASSDRARGQVIDDVTLTPHDETFDRTEEGQVALLCTPAPTSATLAPRLLDRGLRVIDLSGAFRLLDPADYPRWYGFEHPHPELLPTAHYGLVERFEMPDDTRLVANPGCYATAAVLAVAPFLAQAEGPVIIDGKSGTTGAGRKAELSLIYAEVAENLRAYRVTEHQHTPEMERGLSGRTVLFTPHLIPMRRGILVTAYLRAQEGVQERDLSFGCYARQPFISVVDRPPETQRTLHTNLVEVGVRLDERTRTIIAFGAIDNLVKGAAGQAVQNLNLLMGLPPETGL